jgi:hypothetical protein
MRDVKHGREELRFLLDEHGGVAALEEVPDAIPATIEVLGVPAVQVSHSSRQAAPRSLDEQVIVIGHQAVRVAKPVVPLSAKGEKLEETFAITRVSKDPTPFVPARDDVIDRAGEQNAQGARHCLRG